MWVGVVVIELGISLIFCLFTLLLYFILLVRRHLKTVYFDSPPLFLFFVASFMNSQIFAFLSVQWIFFVCGRIPDTPHSSLFLLIPGISGHSFAALYDAATIAVFVQRLCCLKAPLLATKGFQKTLVTVAVAVFCVSTVCIFYFNLTGFQWSERPVPHGCYAYACMSSIGKSGKLANVVVRIALSVVMVISGGIFVFVFQRARMKLNLTAKTKINYCVKYIFVLRASVSVLGGASEMITAHVTGEKLASFIGPYATLLTSTETFLSALVYFLLFMRREKKIFVSASPTLPMK